MTEDTSPENLRKFLESDDLALVRMGISLAKGAGVEVTIKDLERFLKSGDVETVKNGVILADEAGIGAEAVGMLYDSYRYRIGTGPFDIFLSTVPENLRIKLLIEVIGDDSERVSLDALEVLIKIGEPVVGPLIKAATHLIDAGAVQEWKIEMLGQREVIQCWGLCQIATALGEIGDARAVEILIKIISDENADWECGSMEAAKAIGKIGDERAVEPLVKLLENEDWGVRESTEEALKKLGHEVK